MPDEFSDFRNLELAGWTGAAEEYDAAFARLTSQSVPALLEAVGAGPGVRLLDIACGPGYVAGEAARWGASVLGLDFSPTMVALARRRHPGLAFQEGDAEALALADASYDAITMNFGILHLGRPQQAIAEAARVLRPGGRLAFTVWAPAERATAFGIVLGAIARLGNANADLPPGPPFFLFSDAPSATAALEAAGLTEVRITEVPQSWHFTQPTELFEALLHGTVRSSALLKAQTPAALEAIRTAVAAEVARFVSAGTFSLPMPSILSVARKPTVSG